MELFKGKRILLMSGANATCEIIREAKSLGLEVYATDYYKSTKAKQMADKSFLVSTADVPAVAKLCKEEHIDGIFSAFTDSVLPYMQQVGVATGLPFWGNEENIEICIDKMKFKEACSKSGVPVIPWQEVNLETYEEAIKKIKCPVVIKPVDSSGSRGVYKCYDSKLLEYYCKKSFDCSRKKVLLIEKLMRADCEFSAYYILKDGESKLFAMGDRFVEVVDENSAPKPKGMLFPSLSQDAFIKKVDPYVKRFFIDNSMRNGFVFIQGFVDDGDFYINEVGYRLNGGFTYKFNEYYNGFSLVKEMLGFCLSGKISADIFDKTNPFFDGYGLLLTISLREGKIGKIEGVDEIKAFPGVYDMILQNDVGDTMEAPGSGVIILGYIHCVAKNYEDLKDIVKYVSNHLIVEDINGSNQLLSILNTNVLRS